MVTECLLHCLPGWFRCRHPRSHGQEREEEGQLRPRERPLSPSRGSWWGWGWKFRRGRPTLHRVHHAVHQSQERNRFNYVIFFIFEHRFQCFRTKRRSWCFYVQKTALKSALRYFACSLALICAQFSSRVGIWIPIIWIPETFEYQTFWSSDFKWFGIQMVGVINISANQLVNNLNTSSVFKFKTSTEEGFFISWNIFCEKKIYLVVAYSQAQANTSSVNRKQDGVNLSRIRLSCTVFKWHLNTGPFDIQPLFDHLNTKLVGYSDPHYLDESGV